jgi:hypothetical protein
VLVVAGLAAAAGVAAYGFSRSGDESPERAIYGLAHDLEHADAEGACARLFPSGALPPAAAEALGVDRGRDRTSLEVEDRRCLRDFGRAEGLAPLDFEDPRVRSVRRVRVEPQAGVTSAATAQVSFGGDAPIAVKLVALRGKWRVVLER